MPSLFSFQNNDRSIFFFDFVHSFSAENVIRDLIRMNEEDKEKPINIFINSRGGHIVDMFSIVDVMKAIQAPINTFVLGESSSAAALISAVGDKRFISANSEIMLHEAAMQGFGFIDTRDEKFNQQLERLKKDNDKINKLFAQATGKTVEEISKLLSSKDDIFMDAQEAVNFGLADEIMTEDDLNKIKLSESFKTIKLSEPFIVNDSDSDEKLKTVHLLKVGHLNKYNVDITKQTLESLVDNFFNNVRNQDISIDYTHKNDNGENPAAAWIKKLFLSDDNLNLFAKVEYTPIAEKMIKDKVYKYLSVDIDQIWWNEEGKMFNNVLCGATFTNRPSVKGLEALKLSENINNNNNKKIDMELTKEEISSIESIKSEMKIEIKDFHKSFTEMKTTNNVLMSEKKELTANKTKIEAEAKTAKEALIKIQKEQIDSEKISMTDSLIKKGIIAPSQKDKVLDKFSSKSEIEDFYKEAPVIISVEAKGSDLEDPSFDVVRAEKIAKQTSDLSAKDIEKYGVKK